MGKHKTRYFRDGVLDVEILRTGVLLSGHADPRHLPAGADPLPVGVPSNIAVANAEGVAELFARQDHVHNHPAGLGEVLHHAHYTRYLSSWTGIAAPSRPRDLWDAAWDNTWMMMMCPVQIPWTLKVDRIGVYVVVQNGNIELGVYPCGAGTETPDGEHTLVKTGAVACPAVGMQWLTIAETELTAGLYWLAMAADNVVLQIKVGAGFEGLSGRRDGALDVQGRLDEDASVVTAPGDTLNLWLRVSENLGV